MLTRSGVRTRKHAHADPGGQLLRRNDTGTLSLTPAGAGLLHATTRCPPFAARDFNGRRANTSGRIFSADTPVSSAINMTQRAGTRSHFATA